MDMREIRSRARKRFNGACRACALCDGRVCAGEVPGMGGAGSGSAFMANVRAFAGLRLNLRTLYSPLPLRTSCEIWGHTLDFPVMTAPLAGAAGNMGGFAGEEEMAQGLHEGSALAGLLAWSGDGPDPAMFPAGLEAVKKQGGKGIPTIKPRGVEAILAGIRKAEQAGAPAVAVDVDTAAFLGLGGDGCPLSPLGLPDVAALVRATSLPLVLKGIMTPDEASAAASLGVGGIVVSNHGGRVLDSCPGTAEVLPAIVAAVGGRTKVLVDGGIRSGADVLKALALGADAVLIGRPVVLALAGGGPEGVALYFRTLKEELVKAMVLTGTRDLRRVEQRVIYRPDRA
ncbi:MAG: alpha-hydroxy-acid oxidizing protein [Desulfovibrio sp.]|nr:alpha-hydroxy-acid oxidizing protein [Desulfovibrio sp.]